MQNNRPYIAKGSFLNVPKRLFWEYNYDKIDWQKEATGIIQRVIERGTYEEWRELIRFYGENTIIYALKNEINYLPDEIISDVCNYFKLVPTELKCYIRKLSNPRRWT